MFLNKEEIKEFLLGNRIIKENGCWLLITRNRYCYQYYKGIGIHRLSMWIFKDFDLNSSLFICHKCDNPPCFNYEHLFEGTQIDNKRDSFEKNRSDSSFKTRAKPKFCKRGHEFTPENIYNNAGGRRCLTCRKNYGK